MCSRPAPRSLSQLQEFLRGNPMTGYILQTCSKKPISTKDLLRAHPMTRCIFKTCYQKPIPTPEFIRKKPVTGYVSKTCYQKLVAAKCNEITFGRSVIPTDLFSGTGQVPSAGK